MGMPQSAARGIKMTKLQAAAYSAQLAAGLPVSERADAILIMDNGIIGHRDCATYIVAVQQLDWFRAAFPTHADPVIVVGGQGAATPTLLPAGSRSARTADVASVSASRPACTNWRIS